MSHKISSEVSVSGLSHGIQGLTPHPVSVHWGSVGFLFTYSYANGFYLSRYRNLVLPYLDWLPTKDEESRLLYYLAHSLGDIFCWSSLILKHPLLFFTFETHIAMKFKTIYTLYKYKWLSYPKFNIYSLKGIVTNNRKCIILFKTLNLSHCNLQIKEKNNE